MKKIVLDEVRPSRIYSWVYEAEMKLNKGGRAGVAPNPLYGQVSKRAVYAGQAATGEMYCNAQRKLNPTWQPAPDHTPRFEQTANPCVVRSLSNGEFQVRILNPRTVKTEYFVSGQPATPEQIALIDAYKPARADSEGVRIMFPYVDNLDNVVE